MLETRLAKACIIITQTHKPIVVVTFLPTQKVMMIGYSITEALEKKL